MPRCTAGGGDGVPASERAGECGWRLDRLGDHGQHADAEWHLQGDGCSKYSWQRSQPNVSSDCLRCQLVCDLPAHPWRPSPNLPQGAEILRLESALREAKAAATAAADEHARAMGEAGAAHRAAADAMRAEAEGRVRKAEAERARAVAEKDAERRAAVEALEAKLRCAAGRAGGCGRGRGGAGGKRAGMGARRGLLTLAGAPSVGGEMRRGAGCCWNIASA